ncbi:MAG: hypothetical protein J0H53_05210 [Rhizobiales bacterium]|nr:hypothetical protein [Hyphomicrobiales bacterium]
MIVEFWRAVRDLWALVAIVTFVPCVAAGAWAEATGEVSVVDVYYQVYRFSAGKPDISGLEQVVTHRDPMDLPRRPLDVFTVSWPANTVSIWTSSNAKLEQFRAGMLTSGVTIERIYPPRHIRHVDGGDPLPAMLAVMPFGLIAGSFAAFLVARRIDGQRSPAE